MNLARWSAAALVIVALVGAGAAKRGAARPAAPKPPFLTVPRGWQSMKEVPFDTVRGLVGAWYRSGYLAGYEHLYVRVGPNLGLDAAKAARVEAAYVFGSRGTIAKSAAHPVCGGTIPGWELRGTNGTKRYDIIIVVDPHATYEAIYDRTMDFSARPDALAALASFCPTRERYVAAPIVSAIDPPAGWLSRDVSEAAGRAKGTVIFYAPARVRSDYEGLTVERLDSPDGAPANLDDAIGDAIHSGYPEAATFQLDPKQPIDLCNGKGWIVRARGSLSGVRLYSTAVVDIGAPYSYMAIYRRDGRIAEDPAAIAALRTLCPPKAEQ